MASRLVVGMRPVWLRVCLNYIPLARFLTHGTSYIGMKSKTRRA